MQKQSICSESISSQQNQAKVGSLKFLIKKNGHWNLVALLIKFLERVSQSFFLSFFASSMRSQINCLGASRSSMFSHGSLSMAGTSRNMQSHRANTFDFLCGTDNTVSVPIFFYPFTENVLYLTLPYVTTFFLCLGLLFPSWSFRTFYPI